MKSSLRALGAVTAAASLLFISACGSSSDDAGDTTDSKAETVTITDNSGEVEVPKAPENYAVTDNLSMRTLMDWDEKPTAAARSLMPGDWEWASDESIADSGSHREPDLEKIVAAEPDLVINGYRYGEQQDKLEELLPDTPVVTFDRKDDETHIANLERHTEQLGKIFDKEDEAQEKIDKFNDAEDKAKEAYNGEDTVMGLVTSGGDINFSDPAEGRGAAPLFEALDLKPALEVEKGDSNHEGNKISVETIAKSNPDWLIVLDRDAPLAAKGGEAAEDYTPAKDLMAGSAALKNTNAVKKDQIIYLPADLYLDEGIEMYTDIFDQTAEAFSEAK
jgi:iron complex transport system substrate-binding protein